MKKYVFIVLAFISTSAFNAQVVRMSPMTQGIDFTRKITLPAQVGPVNDFEKVFTREETVKLEKIIYDFKNETSNEIAIITVTSISPYEKMKAYVDAVSNREKVGESEENNGLTIIFCNKFKKIRISKGTGTQKILTDQVCKHIIDTIMMPEIKKGAYYDGIEKGLLALIDKWN